MILHNMFISEDEQEFIISHTDKSINCTLFSNVFCKQHIHGSCMISVKFLICFEIGFVLCMLKSLDLLTNAELCRESSQSMNKQCQINSIYQRHVPEFFEAQSHFCFLKCQSMRQMQRKRISIIHICRLFRKIIILETLILTGKMEHSSYATQF